MRSLKTLNTLLVPRNLDRSLRARCVRVGRVRNLMCHKSKPQTANAVRLILGVRQTILRNEAAGLTNNVQMILTIGAVNSRVEQTQTRARVS